MTIVVQRSFTIVPGSFAEFERLSREHVWPYMEARGCRIVGFYTNVHGGPSNEVLLNTAYASLAHWESTRDEVAPPEDASEEAKRLYPAFRQALLDRRKLTVVSSSRVFRLATQWVSIDVREG
jgi:hypothetical protein